MVEQQRSESTRGERGIALAAVAAVLLLPLLLTAVACPVAMCGAAFYLHQAETVGGVGVDQWFGDQWLLGIVREAEFLPLAPGTVLGAPARLTGIPMQAAVSPESEELDLARYEGRVILVRGHDGGGWIYSAAVIVKAGPILSAVVRLALVLRAWTSAGSPSQEIAYTSHPPAGFSTAGTGKLHANTLSPRVNPR